jgi:hypothetical protein
MSARPEPPVPAEVDLRDFAYMPLDVRRLLTSETWVLGRPEEKVAAINLWCEAWHQVPCGSLPDNERMLAHLSQVGAGWKKLRDHAMRGWVLCSDGRWYHPVIVEKALESWAKKVAQRQRTQRATQARWKGKPDPTPPGGSSSPSPEHPRPPVPTDSVTDHPTESVTDSVTFTKGEGREGKGSSLALAASARPPELPPAVRLAIEARQHGVQVTGSDPRLIAAAEQGVTVETLRDVIAECARRKGGTPSIGYVLATLKGWAADAADLRLSGAAPPLPRRTALDEQAEVLHRITGGFHGRAPTDPRTIDVDSQPEAPRIATGGR